MFHADLLLWRGNPEIAPLLCRTTFFLMYGMHPSRNGAATGAGGKSGKGDCWAEQPMPLPVRIDILFYVGRHLFAIRVGGGGAVSPTATNVSWFFFIAWFAILAQT